MNKVSIYLQETYNELIHKVSWPSWADLQSSSIVVMVASLIIALVIFAMDFSFQNVFEFMYENIRLTK
jgi:preprotein translocase subunit SecE